MDTLFQVYGDWVDVNQTFVFPHYLFGTESSWSSAIGTGSLSSIENQSGYAQDLLQLGSSWNYTDLTYATVQYADKVDPGNATADDFDINTNPAHVQAKTYRPPEHPTTKLAKIFKDYHMKKHKNEYLGIKRAHKNLIEEPYRLS